MDESDQIVAEVIAGFGGREVKYPKNEWRQRSITQKARLLALLSDGLWHSTDEIRERIYGKDTRVGARIASRINELKKAGHKITCDDLTYKVYGYRLVREHESIQGAPLVQVPVPPVRATARHELPQKPCQASLMPAM